MPRTPETPELTEGDREAPGLVVRTGTEQVQRSPTRSAAAGWHR